MNRSDPVLVYIPNNPNITKWLDGEPYSFICVYSKLGLLKTLERFGESIQIMVAESEEDFDDIVMKILTDNKIKKVEIKECDGQRFRTGVREALDIPIEDNFPIIH